MRPKYEGDVLKEDHVWAEALEYQHRSRVGSIARLLACPGRIGKDFWE